MIRLLKPISPYRTLNLLTSFLYLIIEEHISFMNLLTNLFDFSLRYIGEPA